MPNAYKLMCFDRNINGTKDGEILEVWLVSCILRCVKLAFKYFFESFEINLFSATACWKEALCFQM